VDRNALLQYVHEQHGVGIVLRYWPLHLQSLMRAKGHRFGEAPVCEKVWFEQQLNLPIGPLFADDRVDAVCDALADGMARLRR
jgi:perosamine synthetase